jgi:hypothetical protein
MAWCGGDCCSVIAGIRHPQFDAICTSRNTRTAKLGQQAMFSEGLQRPLLTDLDSGFEDQDISKPAKWTGKLEMGEEQHCQQIPCAMQVVQRPLSSQIRSSLTPNYGWDMLRCHKIKDYCKVPIQLHANASVHDLFGNMWGDFGAQDASRLAFLLAATLHWSGGRWNSFLCPAIQTVGYENNEWWYWF